MRCHSSSKTTSSPRLTPGKVDVFRLLALTLVFVTIIFQIVLIHTQDVATNEYGTTDGFDPIGFAFVSAMRAAEGGNN
jgi:hypothetical protein